MSKSEITGITLNTGLKKIPINFEDRGETAYIYINPTDKDLAVRCKKFPDRIEERLKEFEDIKLDADGMPEDLDYIDEFEKMTNFLYEEIDKAFGSRICDVVFKYCNPFAIVNGNYYFMTFFEAIIPVIQQFSKAENEKANANVNKYIDKYGKYIKK